MKEVGVRNPSKGCDIFGFKGLKALYWNQNEPALYEYSLLVVKPDRGRRRNCRGNRHSHWSLPERQIRRE